MSLGPLFPGNSKPGQGVGWKCELQRGKSGGLALESQAVKAEAGGSLPSTGAGLSYIVSARPKDKQGNIHLSPTTHTQWLEDLNVFSTFRKFEGFRKNSN